MRRENKQQGGGVLPPGYTQLEYIEGTGTQWINTGVKMLPNIETYLKLSYSSVPSDVYNYGVYFGAPERLAVNYRVRSFVNIDFMTSYYQTGNVQLTTGHEYEISQTTTQISVTDLTQTATASRTIPASTTTGTHNMYLFSLNLNGNALTPMQFRAERWYAKVGQTYIADLIPALRTQDGKPGLYDIINNVFLTNQGTDEFLYA